MLNQIKFIFSTNKMVNEFENRVTKTVILYEIKDRDFLKIFHIYFFDLVT